MTGKDLQRIVLLAGLLGEAGTDVWWRYTDQNRQYRPAVLALQQSREDRYNLSYDNQPPNGYAVKAGIWL